jgi:hypothetical protein
MMNGFMATLCFSVATYCLSIAVVIVVLVMRGVRNKEQRVYGDESMLC